MQQILDIAVQLSVITMALVMVADYATRIGTSIAKVRQQCQADRLSEPQLIVDRLSLQVTRAELALDALEFQAQQSEASLQLGELSTQSDDLLDLPSYSDLFTATLSTATIEQTATPVANTLWQDPWADELEPTQADRFLAKEAPHQANDATSLDQLSIRQLKAIAQQRQIPRYSRLTKAQLIETLAI